MKLLYVCGICFLLASCAYRGSEDEGPIASDSIHIPLGGADHANVELDIGAGELTVNGGAADLINGDFDYRGKRHPEVQQSMNGSHAVVSIREPKGIGGPRHGKYRWRLNLSNNVVTDLSVNCGAGQADLNLGSVDLRSLEVNMGAGRVRIDLRGKPRRDYDVHVSGGVGEADVDLPQNAGIWAQAHGGLGGIDVTGLHKVGDHWENDEYGKAKANVKVTVEGGIGQIRIHG